MKTEYTTPLKNLRPSIRIELPREEAKLLRRIISTGTWDAVNLSEDEEVLIQNLTNVLNNYLIDDKKLPF